MKLLKNILALMLVCMIAFSCKSEKKESDVTDEEAMEVVSESDDEMTSEAIETTLEEDELEAEVESEEMDALEEPKQITVVYPKDSKLANEVKASIATFLEEHPGLKTHFEDAYGFAVYPKITKAGLGIGGAGGHGLVFDDKTVIGGSKLSQATFGLQAGGQTYMELIFFEDQAALLRFTDGKIKFSGQASAVAMKEGASTDIDYQDGVAIFTKTIGGLMAEASVGGQGFKFSPGIN